MTDQHETTLESLGLEPLVDISAMTTEQKEARIAALRNAAAKQDSLPPRADAVVPVVSNVAPDNAIPTPEELRARVAKVEREREAAEERWRQRNADDRKIRDDRWPSMVPPEWRNASMELLPQPLHEMAMEWISLGEDDRRNLLLFGPVGVGKTTVAYAVAREAYIRHETILIKSMAVLLDELRPNSGHPETMDAALEVDVLVIDDLGSERRTDWADERLAIIIDHRWQWHKSIVLTSNVEPLELGELVGERLMSRLSHGSTIYRLTGDDLRLS